jgi:hypothetical protein
MSFIISYNVCVKKGPLGIPPQIASPRSRIRHMTTLIKNPSVNLTQPNLHPIPITYLEKILVMAKNVSGFNFHLSIQDTEKFLNTGNFSKYQANRTTTTTLCFIRFRCITSPIFYLFLLSFLYGNASPFRKSRFQSSYTTYI